MCPFNPTKPWYDLDIGITRLTGVIFSSSQKRDDAGEKECKTQNKTTAEDVSITGSNNKTVTYIW